MKVIRTGKQDFSVEFDSEEELRKEHATNLSMGGLRLPTSEKLVLFSTLAVTLRGPLGGEAVLQGRVVAPLPDGVALSVEGDPAKLLEALLAAPAGGNAKDATVWDRLRNMPRMEKILFAAKADRTERALMLQDNDPQVLQSLLKNPRLTVDEVVRLAKSPFLTYQVAELMMKSTQWFANLDVRVALVHNAKTPQPFAMRILQTLPEAEVRTIARGAATSMALKTAALKRLQGGG